MGDTHDDWGVPTHFPNPFSRNSLLQKANFPKIRMFPNNQFPESQFPEPFFPDFMCPKSQQSQFPEFYFPEQD